MERDPAQFATSSQVTDSQFELRATDFAEIFAFAARKDLGLYRRICG
jgi:hypothetical protein